MKLDGYGLLRVYDSSKIRGYIFFFQQTFHQGSKLSNRQYYVNINCELKQRYFCRLLIFLSSIWNSHTETSMSKKFSKSVVIIPIFLVYLNVFWSIRYFFSFSHLTFPCLLCNCVIQSDFHSDYEEIYKWLHSIIF